MATVFSADLIAELELLTQFDLDSRLSGIKIHHGVSTDAVSAAKRLYDKGVISQEDGGYLTDRGIEVTEALQRTLAVIADA